MASISTLRIPRRVMALFAGVWIATRDKVRFGSGAVACIGPFPARKCHSAVAQFGHSNVWFAYARADNRLLLSFVGLTAR